MRSYPESKKPVTVLTLDEIRDIFNLPDFGDVNEANETYMSGSAVEIVRDKHYKQCEQCEGDGTRTCPYCSYDLTSIGEEHCDECEDDGFVDCDMCDGTGYVKLDYDDVVNFYELERDIAYFELQDYLHQKWENSIIATAEKYFDWVQIRIDEVEIRTRKAKYNAYELTPMRDWERTADLLAEVIAGYGIFTPWSGQELRETGPYPNYWQAVRSHLWWLRFYGSVYGCQNPDRYYADHLEDSLRYW